MPQHTSGRWMDCPVDEDHTNILVDHGPGKFPTKIATVWAQPNKDIDHPEVAGNSRLITNAPDLLAALKAVLPTLDGKASRGKCLHDDNDGVAYPSWQQLAEQVRAAIAAAERTD